MIRLLGESDGGLIELLPPDCLSAMRIRALWKAYGTGYGFVRFYADEAARLAIGVQDAYAVLWLREPQDRETLAEAATFLSLTARTFLTEVPLPVEGRLPRVGKSYRCGGYPAVRQREVSGGLQEGYEVLSWVFPETINGTSFRQWYADLSHRVRHGMSKIYTLEGVCTGVRYCVEGGRMAVVQLATLPEYRGQGLARRLLSHMVADNLPENGILLQSQDEGSDRFYEQLGFEQAGGWYFYGD